MVHSQHLQKDPTCCSLVAFDGFTLGTYDNTDLGSPEESTEKIAEGNLEGLLLGTLLGSFVGLVIGFNKVAVLGSSYGKGLGTTIGGLWLGYNWMTSWA